jgi:hypothetical protein
MESSHGAVEAFGRNVEKMTEERLEIASEITGFAVKF